MSAARQLTLSDIAEGTEAGKATFKLFNERARYRTKTDLRRVFYELKERNKALSYDDFIKVFKALHDIKAGSLVVGRGHDPDRFAWNYNLKELALAARKGTPLSALIPLDSKGETKGKIKVKGLRQKFKESDETMVNSSESRAGHLQLINGSLANQIKLQFSVTLSPSTSEADLGTLMELIKTLHKK